MFVSNKGISEEKKSDKKVVINAAHVEDKKRANIGPCLWRLAFAILHTLKEEISPATAFMGALSLDGRVV